MKSLGGINRDNAKPKPKPKRRIKPAKPSTEQRLIAFGHLTETAERCEQMRDRLRAIDPKPGHAETFRKQARALRAVAEWIRPDNS